MNSKEYYAIQNADGFWVGIWNKREVAELVLSKGLKSNEERLVVLVEKHEQMG